MTLTPILPVPPPRTEIEIPALINVATRKQHTELNRLIVERLALSLPPNAIDPAILGQGLTVFARIYYTFEAAWQELESCADEDDELRQRLVDLHIGKLCRTERLQDDIKHITTVTGIPIETTCAKEQQPILDAISDSIRARPHILIAYAWVMYTAIFSGGRWIRAQLASAGPEFWTNTSAIRHLDEKVHTPIDELPGFSFLRFDGDNDGEDIKAEFKLRLKAADELLTTNEKEDVTYAAVTLFDDCIAMVHMLDSNMHELEVKRTWLWILLGVLWKVAIALRLGVRSATYFVSVSTYVPGRFHPQRLVYEAESRQESHPNSMIDDLDRAT